MSTSVGLDIGTRSITVVQLRWRRAYLTVTNFGGVELPRGAVRRGVIQQVPIVAAAVRTLLSSAGIRRRRMWAGISHAELAVRSVELAWRDDAHVRRTLRYAAAQHLPGAIEDAVVDVVATGEPHHDDRGWRRQALLVGAQRAAVALLTETLEQAGVDLVGVDIMPLATLRATGANVVLHTGAEVIVDVGGGVTELIVHQSNIPVAVEVLPVGGDDITEALVQALDVDWASAETTKRAARVGYSAGVADRIVTERTTRIVDEIRRSITEVGARADVRLGSIAVVGGGALLNGFAGALEDAVRLPVSVVNPLHRLHVRKTVYGRDDLDRIGAGLGGAIGLAMRGI